MSGRKLRHKFVEAKGFWLWLINRLQCDGLTMPWRTIFMRPGHLDDHRLRIHELVHIEQIERHGAIRFTVLYLWYLLRFGYWLNPFEIEAYGIENEAKKLNTLPSHDGA